MGARISTRVQLGLLATEHYLQSQENLRTEKGSQVPWHMPAITAYGAEAAL